MHLYIFNIFIVIYKYIKICTYKYITFDKREKFLLVKLARKILIENMISNNF